jgi:hypothetical protein
LNPSILTEEDVLDKHREDIVSLDSKLSVITSFVQIKQLL